MVVVQIIDDSVGEATLNGFLGGDLLVEKENLIGSSQAELLNESVSGGAFR